MKLPEFRLDSHTVLSNLKTSFSGSFHAFAFAKVTLIDYLGAFSYRFSIGGSSGGHEPSVWFHAICSTAGTTT